MKNSTLSHSTKFLFSFDFTGWFDSTKESIDSMKNKNDLHPFQYETISFLSFFCRHSERFDFYCNFLDSSIIMIKTVFEYLIASDIVMICELFSVDR